MPSWFKRLIVILLVVLAVGAGAVFAFGEAIASAVTRQALARLTRAAAARGIELRDLHFESARLDGLTTIRCDELIGTALLRLSDAAGEPRKVYLFSARHLIVSAGAPWGGRSRVTLVDGNIQQTSGEGEILTNERVTGIQLRLEIPVSWWRVRAAATLADTEMRRLFTEGRTTLPLEFNAVVGFAVGGRAHELAVHTARTPDGGARVVIDRADIEQVSRQYAVPLTKTEIDLVERYPHRARTLLRMSEKASRAAEARRRQDRSFPYDAYRHVYWSWMLTRTFGPDFSEEVTDAHEKGATYEFGSASRRMDLHNNAVGRAYAIAGVPESELVDRVLHDENVLRAPPPVPPATPGRR